MKTLIFLLASVLLTHSTLALEPQTDGACWHLNGTKVYAWENPDCTEKHLSDSKNTPEVEFHCEAAANFLNPKSKIFLPLFRSIDEFSHETKLICLPVNMPLEGISALREELSQAAKFLRAEPAGELALIDEPSGAVSVVDDDDEIAISFSDAEYYPKKPLSWTREKWEQGKEAIAKFEADYPGALTRISAMLTSGAYLLIGKKQYAMHHFIVSEHFLQQHLSDKELSNGQQLFNLVSSIGNQLLIIKGFGSESNNANIAFLIGLQLLNHEVTDEYSFIPLALLLGSAVMDNSQHPLLRAMYLIQEFAHFKGTKNSKSEAKFVENSARATKEGRKLLKACKGAMLTSDSIEEGATSVKKWFSEECLPFEAANADPGTWEEFFVRQGLLLGSHLIAAHFTGAPGLTRSTGPGIMDFKFTNPEVWLTQSDAWQTLPASMHHQLLADGFADRMYDDDWSYGYTNFALDLVATAARAAIIFYILGPEHAGVEAITGLAQTTLPPHIKQHLAAITGLLAFHTPIEIADPLGSVFDVSGLETLGSALDPLGGQVPAIGVVAGGPNHWKSAGMTGVNYLSHLTMYNSLTEPSEKKYPGKDPKNIRYFDVAVEFFRSYYDSAKEGFWTMMGFQEIYTETEYQLLRDYNNTGGDVTDSENLEEL